MKPAPLVQNLGKEDSEPLMPGRASRPWQVLHTCDSISQIADVLAGELAVGMRPSVVMPAGFIPFADALRPDLNAVVAQFSLLNAWNDVRQWRKVILDADPVSAFDLLHAHSFAAGMAGVRNYPATVYDIDRFIEDAATSIPARANSGEHGSWLSRSFRAAEQFVLSRAAAVVVRSESMRQAVIRRGTAAENVFAVPAVLSEEESQRSPANEEWLRSIGIQGAARIIFYAPQCSLGIDASQSLSELSRGLLHSFVATAMEKSSAYLLVECEESARKAATDYLESVQIADRVKLISDCDSGAAFDAADVVIADSPSTNMANPVARRALATGKVLLAADLPCNRDITPSGRGCLWYCSGDYKDLSHRMVFVAANADFRKSLANAGCRYLTETCSPAAVAMRYDAIYRLAAARRKSGGLQTPAIRLSPISATL